jgi:hypothetical protein
VWPPCSAKIVHEHPVSAVLFMARSKAAATGERSIISCMTRCIVRNVLSELCIRPFNIIHVTDWSSNNSLKPKAHPNNI